MTWFKSWTESKLRDEELDERPREEDEGSHLVGGQPCGSPAYSLVVTVSSPLLIPTSSLFSSCSFSSAVFFLTCSKIGSRGKGPEQQQTLESNQEKEQGNCKIRTESLS